MNAPQTFRVSTCNARHDGCWLVTYRTQGRTLSAVSTEPMIEGQAFTVQSGRAVAVEGVTAR